PPDPIRPSTALRARGGGARAALPGGRAPPGDHAGGARPRARGARRPPGAAPRRKAGPRPCVDSPPAHGPTPPRSRRGRCFRVMKLNLSDEPLTAELLAEALGRTGSAVISVNGTSMHPTLQFGWRVYLRPARG